MVLISVILLVLAAGLAVGALALIAKQRNQTSLLPALAAVQQLNADWTGDLRFRPPVATDLDFYIAMTLDPTAAEANGWSGREEKAVRRMFNSEPLFQRLKARDLVAVHAVADTPVATMSFQVSPLQPREGRSIGIHVHPDHRGNGYGREIMAAAITLLRSSPAPVHVGTLVTNTGMQRIMDQLGYSPRPGTLPYNAPNGKTYDSFWYDCGIGFEPPVWIPSS
jgi:RimJ/RimL family protein N-acetyltransferase